MVGGGLDPKIQRKGRTISWEIENDLKKGGRLKKEEVGHKVVGHNGDLGIKTSSSSENEERSESCAAYLRIGRNRHIFERKNKEVGFKNRVRKKEEGTCPF